MTTAHRPRLPAGQRWTNDWPVHQHGDLPRPAAEPWTLRVWGRVLEEAEWDEARWAALPRIRVRTDVHCSQGWSVKDLIWEGVSSRELLSRLRLRTDAAFAMIHAADDYTACLPMWRFASADVLFADRLAGQPLSRERGAPVRLVAPALFLSRSPKWIRGIEFLGKAWPDHGELSGPGRRADPWKPRADSE